MCDKVSKIKIQDWVNSLVFHARHHGIKINFIFYLDQVANGPRKSSFLTILKKSKISQLVCQISNFFWRIFHFLKKLSPLQRQDWKNELLQRSLRYILRSPQVCKHSNDRANFRIFYNGILLLGNFNHICDLVRTGTRDWTEQQAPVIFLGFLPLDQLKPFILSGKW